ncbi:MAG: cytochrome c oxidase subunit 3 [Acidobacteria bacterium]|nr:cytochrome c oxidase subunit 3 [Acidobacteriota bacterium]
MSEHADTAHPALRHHFDDLNQQHAAGTLGMWFFLVTEILFFGPLFFTYALFRSGSLDPSFQNAFIAASHHQNITLGLTNTIVLIASSLTVALGVYFAQTNKKKPLVLMLVLTLLCGVAFLVIKGIEYNQHFAHHLFPGQGFHWDGAPELARGGQMFYILYFCMTGLHAFHMVIGIGIFIYILMRAMRNDFSSDYYVPIEVSGLYWHFVDIVWIFLFPMLYLIDPASKH